MPQDEKNQRKNKRNRRENTKTASKKKVTKFVSLGDLAQEFGVREKQVEDSLKEHQFPVIKVTPALTDLRKELTNLSVQNKDSLDRKKETVERTEYEPETTPPLVYREDACPLLLGDWYGEIKVKSNANQSFLPLIGVVSVGGFLQGDGENVNNEKPFFLALQPGVNAFIGSQGSGKSTALGLLSLIVSSLNSEKDKRVVPQNRADYHTYGAFSTRDFLKQKGIKKYACFFQERTDNKRGSRKLYVFYADYSQNEWSLFEKKNDGWIPSKRDLALIFPDLLVINQGRIQQYVESRNPFIINQILEELNPKFLEMENQLGKTKEKIARKYKELKSATEKYYSNRSPDQDKKETLRSLSLNSQVIQAWEMEKKDEIERLHQAIEEGKPLAENIEEIEKLISKASKYRPTFGRLSIVATIAIEKKLGLDCIFLGLLPKSLIKELSIAKFKSIDEQRKLLNAFVDKLGDRLSIIISIANQIVVDDEIFEDVSEYGLKDNTSSNKPNFYEWNNALSDLSKVVKSIFRQKSEIAAYQRNYCNEVEAKTSFIQEQKIKFNIVHEMNEIDEFDAAATLYQSISKRLNFIEDEEGSEENLAEYLKSLESYKKSLKTMMAELRESESFVQRQESSIGQKRFNSTEDYRSNMPIEITLKQGNVDRKFDELSYGQKTGIITTIFSVMSESEIIIIDQPEDNLDNAAISTILLPTIYEISDQGVHTVLVTHRTALVLGLRILPHNIFIMKTPQEFGGIEHCGTLEQPETVEHMYSILGQGLEGLKIQFNFFNKFSFFKKMNRELNFVGDTRLRDMISDIRSLGYSQQAQLQSRAVKHDVRNAFIPNLSFASDAHEEISREVKKSLKLGIEPHLAKILHPKKYLIGLINELYSKLSRFIVRSSSQKASKTLLSKVTTLINIWLDSSKKRLEDETLKILSIEEGKVNSRLQEMNKKIEKILERNAEMADSSNQRQVLDLYQILVDSMKHRKDGIISDIRPVRNINESRKGGRYNLYV